MRTSYLGGRGGRSSRLSAAGPLPGAWCWVAEVPLRSDEDKACWATWATWATWAAELLMTEVMLLLLLVKLVEELERAAAGSDPCWHGPS